MKITPLDLIDFTKVDALLEGFNKTTGFVTAILDLEGNILSQSGWRRICTQFHRVNPQTSINCTISDTVFAGEMAEEGKYHFYKCLNGMVDVAVPLVINGEHVANLFSGQFFFEQPDRAFFKAQAGKYGFDENDYLVALEGVPVVSKERVKTAMDFLLAMTQLISEMTFQKLEQRNLNEAILQSEERFRAFMDETPVYAYIKDGSLNHIFSNKRVSELVGSDRIGQTTESAKTIFTPEVADYLETVDKDILTGHSSRRDLEYKAMIGGEERWLNDIKFALSLADGSRAVGGFAIDITERKAAEAGLQRQTDELRSRNEELERFNRATVGRELEMVALKQQVNDLSGKLGQEPPYPLTFLK